LFAWAGASVLEAEQSSISHQTPASNVKYRDPQQKGNVSNDINMNIMQENIHKKHCMQLKYYHLPTVRGD